MPQRFTDRKVNARLQAWLNEYDDIYDEFLAAVAATGVEFGEPFADEQRIEAAKARLRSKGARFRNGDASISTGALSSACEACAENEDSLTFLFSLKCNRSCYFCFNANQDDYCEHMECDRDWRMEFRGLAETGRSLSHIALTGGEPLLNPDETLAFLAMADELWPQAHKRLYTTGDLLDEALLDRLIEEGLSEIRFSVKIEDDERSKRAALDRVRMACDRCLDVMVEMPAVPGTFEEMKRLLAQLDEIGVHGINLLEFCYALNNWSEFARRGFRLRNPPFPVLYEYSYAGSLPVEGSEFDCLRLLEYAIDEGLSLGVHYCSLENKHRTQICQQNRVVLLDDSCYELDAEDFFYKTVKAFGADAACAKDALAQMGADAWRYDALNDCVMLHPRLLPKIAPLCLDVVVSFNVLELRGSDIVLRELALKPVL